MPRVVSDNHSNHNLPIGAEVTFFANIDGTDHYTQGGVGDEVAIDPRDLDLTDYAALAERAAKDRQSANARFQEARAASEKAALRELVFTAASYGVTRLLLEPSDQGDYMTVSEIEPDVDSEAEDIIYDAGTYDLSDYSHADWAGETGVEVEEFSHRDDQIRKATVDIKVAAEALLAPEPDGADVEQRETIYLTNDAYDPHGDQKHRFYDEN